MTDINDVPIIRYKNTDVGDEENRKKAIKKNIKKEVDATKLFVSQNPYPSRNEMIKLLKNHPSGIQITAEYGHSNHMLMEEIYYNIRDKEKCAEIGKKIYEIGGHNAMTWNYYSLFCTPLYRSKNSAVRASIYLVSRWWNGVGEWIN